MKSLHEKLRRAQKTICRQRKLIRVLRNDVSSFQQQTSPSSVKDFPGVLGNDSILLSLLKNNAKKSRGRRYTEYDKTFASAIYYCSPKAYNFLRKYFGLPTVRSLRLWLQNLSVAPGINQNIMKLLKFKVTQLPEQDRVVSLVFDEMSLKENVTYNSSADIFEGYPDLSEELKCGDSSANQPLTFANQATVVMVRGLKKNFKQIIGYFLTAGPMAAETLKEVITHSLHKVQETGLIVKAMVCDQGSNNVKMHRLFGISEEKPYIIFNGEKVFAFFDAPHLLKSIRNNFKKFDLVYNGKVASFRHVVEFYEKDRMMNPRLAPKITRKHIELPPFSPMRVCLATQLLSHSVSRGILTHVALNSMPSVAAYTADFIDNFDSLFDVFNSSLKFDAKVYRRALSLNSLHWEFLEDIKKKLNMISFTNSKRPVPPCVKGWLLNISSVKQLWKELNEKFNFQFLLTRRLTQDCLENLFSVIRSKGFHNVTPDCSKFRSAVRGVMSNQMLMPSPDGNCELDLSKCVLLKSDFQKHCAGITLTKKVDHVVEDVDSLEIDIVQENSVSYVAGWACSKIDHEDCKKHLSSFEESSSPSSIHISMKKYENANFLYPNELAAVLSQNIYSTFKSKFRLFLGESRSGVKTKLMQELQVPPGCPVCTECLTVFSNKFFNVLIKCFLKTSNDTASKRLNNKENKKAKKVMHR